MDSIKQMGWTLRFRFRTIKKKRRDGKGKARGFYEGDYVYVRVTDPRGKQRDVYVGRTDVGLSSARARRVETVAIATPARGSGRGARGRKGGQKRATADAIADTRDPHDDRTRPLPFSSRWDTMPPTQSLGAAIAKHRSKQR